MLARLLAWSRVFGCVRCVCAGAATAAVCVLFGCTPRSATPTCCCLRVNGCCKSFAALRRGCCDCIDAAPVFLHRFRERLPRVFECEMPPRLCCACVPPRCATCSACTSAACLRARGCRRTRTPLARACLSRRGHVRRRRRCNCCCARLSPAVGHRRRGKCFASVHACAALVLTRTSTQHVCNRYVVPLWWLLRPRLGLTPVRQRLLPQVKTRKKSACGKGPQHLQTLARANP
jgi:hypothetical protein